MINESEIQMNHILKASTKMAVAMGNVNIDVDLDPEPVVSSLMDTDMIDLDDDLVGNLGEFGMFKMPQERERKRKVRKDFETEEEWAEYQKSDESKIRPQKKMKGSAKHGKGDKRLERDFSELSKVYETKYGISLDKKKEITR